ncbi:MAG: hypothetical protein PHF83_06300, partial [Candidatus Methanomethylophilus sp.]|nr:hypothetical protein [Methanomethylophilus sp.]
TCALPISKAQDETYTYEFSGWDSAPAAYDGTVTSYTAAYTPTFRDYTVSFVISNDSYGSVDPVTVAHVHYNSRFVVNDATITIDGTVVTATPNVSNVQYVYAFDSWSVTDSDVIIGDITVTATFTRSAIVVPVEPPVPNIVTIYLPSGSGYSIYDAPSVTVEYGASYSFEVTLERAYDQSIPTVTANDKTVTAAGSIYSLGSVTEDTYITVSDVYMNVYAVVGTIVNGTVTHSDQQVYYDTPSSEMVFTAADGYVITGYVINQKYTAIPSDGISTFTFLIVNSITENIEITAITAIEDAAENAVNAGIYISSTAMVGATTWCASTVISRWRTFGDAEGVRPVQQRRAAPAAGSAGDSEQHDE